MQCISCQCILAVEEHVKRCEHGELCETCTICPFCHGERMEKAYGRLDELPLVGTSRVRELWKEVGYGK